jgi:hypothetical protein
LQNSPYTQQPISKETSKKFSIRGAGERKPEAYFYTMRVFFGTHNNVVRLFRSFSAVVAGRALKPLKEEKYHNHSNPYKQKRSKPVAPCHDDDVKECMKRNR